MEAITSNVLHLGVIALEDEFQRGAGQRDGKKKKKGSSYLNGIYKSPGSILKIFVCVLFYLIGMLFKIHAHEQKQLLITWLVAKNLKRFAQTQLKYPLYQAGI